MVPNNFSPQHFLQSVHKSVLTVSLISLFRFSQAQSYHLTSFFSTKARPANMNLLKEPSIPIKPACQNSAANKSAEF